jgi:anti-sigma B factor antagonist
VSEFVDSEPTHEQLMVLRRRDDARCILIDVRGEIDAMTAPRLRETLLTALDEADGRAVILDLAGIELLASAGLAAIVEAQEVSESSQVSLRVVVDDTNAAVRPLQVTGLAASLRLYHDVADALRG